jgi:ABC-2 type transport system ATP-binding protein
MLKQGRVVALDSTPNLLKRVHHLFLKLRVTGHFPEELRALEHGGGTGTHVLRMENFDQVETTLASVRRAGCSILEMELVQPDLEDVFVDLMRRT